MISLNMNLMCGSKTPEKDKSTESSEENEPMVDESFEVDDDGEETGKRKNKETVSFNDLKNLVFGMHIKMKKLGCQTKFKDADEAKKYPISPPL